MKNSFTLKSQIPNFITLIRLFLIIPIVIFLLGENFFIASWLFLLSATTDILDGFIAKKINAVTKFGSIIDPIADKILLVSCFTVLTFLGYIPLWLCILVVFRDLVIVAAVTGYFLLSETTKIKPSKMSKLNTFVQISLVLYVMIASQFHFEHSIETVLVALVATTTLASGLGYAVLWIRKAYENIKSSN